VTAKTPPEAPPPAKHASTVVVLRPGDWGPEILFVCRQQSMKFMGGAHVFPGGKLDASDFSPEVLASLPSEVRGRAARALEPSPGQVLEADVAVGLHVAALRELFEETGVLVTEPAPRPRALAAVRARVAREPGCFAAALAEHGLRPAVERLTYVAHWVTPTAESRRFDTRFFVTALPAGQEAEVELGESSALVWLTAAGALARHRAREIVLWPPTLRTVEALERQHGAAPTGDPPVRAVMPKTVVVGESVTALLPWDPDYASAPGEGWPFAASEASAFVAGGARIALMDRVFTSGGDR
jgi:8-oxo-dGTP pyrophosphatase MutT (NUDIX family)